MRTGSHSHNVREIACWCRSEADSLQYPQQASASELKKFGYVNDQSTPNDICEKGLHYQKEGRQILYIQEDVHNTSSTIVVIMLR